MVVPLPVDLAGSEVSASALMEELFQHEKYRERFLEMMGHPEVDMHFGFEIELLDLLSACPAAGGLLHDHPAWLLNALDNALRELQDLMQQGRRAGGGGGGEGGGGSALELRRKPFVHARLTGYPRTSDFVRPSISSLRAVDKGKLLQVAGTVIRAGARHVAIRSKMFQCSAPKCGYQFLVPIEIEHDNTIKMPKVCPSPVPQKGRRCMNGAFLPLEDRPSNCTDYREIRIQEPMQVRAWGGMRRGAAG